MQLIISCLCGQKNRVVVGKRSVCGKCRAPLAPSGGLPRTIDIDDFADRLARADKAEAFGRAHFPEDYILCGGCGETFHKRDGHRHDACNPRPKR